jgi:Integrase core domain/Integrase zinc binding domain
MFAVHRTSEPWTGRQAIQLAFIAEFTSDIRHISGKDNEVADALSRPLAAAPETAAALAAVAAAPAELDYAAIAARQQECEQTQQAVVSSALRVRPVILGGVSLLCDVSTGVLATRRLLAAKVIWPKMAADIGHWCRECQDCARGKVTVQPSPAVVPIPVPKERFSHLHVDLVGHFPVSEEGYTYLFTVIDHSTRWLEAVPIKNMEVRMCADALVDTWISRFGVPAVITSDRRTQF